MVSLNIESLRYYEQELRKINLENMYIEESIPLLTKVDIYQESSIERELYKIIHEGEALALRADFSMALVDKVVRKNIEFPYRAAYYGEIYRLDKVNQWQVGVELLGESSIAGEREMLKVIKKYIGIFPQEEYIPCINYMPFIDLIIIKLNLTSKEVKLFKSNLVKHNYVKIKEVMKDKLSYETFNLMWSLFNERNINKALDLIEQLFPSEKFSSEIFALLKELSADYYFDIGLVKNLNYYTGLVFEVYAKGSPQAIITGGRYDNLAKQFGQNISAIGFAVDMSWLGGYLCKS